METQTRDPLVHLDHQGCVAQKVNKYAYLKACESYASEHYGQK